MRSSSDAFMDERRTRENDYDPEGYVPRKMKRDFEKVERKPTPLNRPHDPLFDDDDLAAMYAKHATDCPCTACFVEWVDNWYGATDAPF